MGSLQEVGFVYSASILVFCGFTRLGGEGCLTEKESLLLGSARKSFDILDSLRSDPCLFIILVMSFQVTTSGCGASNSFLLV